MPRILPVGMKPRVTKKVVERLLARAVADVTRTEGGFTNDTAQTEWNLAHHLAGRVQRLLRRLDCDVDPRKPGYGDRRPDIVFHERGVHRSNFLVIEIKRNGTRRSFNADARKIQDYWFTAPLLYRFGAAINIRSDGQNEIVVFRNQDPRAKRKSGRRRTE